MRRAISSVMPRLARTVVCALLLLAAVPAEASRVGAGHAISGNVEIGLTKAPLVGTEVRLLAPETTWSRAVRQLAGRPREVVDRTTTDRVGAFRLMAPEAGPYGVEVEDPRGVNQLEILVIGEVELGTWPLVEQRRVPGRVDEGELALQTFGGLEWTPWPADLAIRAIEVWGPSAILPPRPGWGLAPALVGTPGRPPRRCDAQGCLPPPASREVQIVVTSGTEPAPAVVALGPEGWAYGLSDRGGRLDLKVPSGATAVVLWAQDGRRVEVEVPERVARPIRVELPDRIPEVEVALGGLPGPFLVAGGDGWFRHVPTGGSVRVEVVDHSGGGIEAARVSVARAAPGGGFPSPWGRTNADGIVELPAVPAGDVVVEVEADGYEPKRLGARIDLGAVPILRVELAGGWRLAGRVVDPSGRGVVAMVSATGGTWERYELVREDGVFDFGSVPAGSIRLLAVGGEEARPVSTSRVIELREDRVDVDLLLEPKGRIEGRLVGVAAAEAAGARVTVFDSSSLPRQSAELAWDGAFRVDGLEADRYRVAVTLEDGRSGSAEVEVGPAETAAGVEVRLAPTTRVSGTILIDGNPAADVQVRAQGSSPTGWRTTDLAGRFELHLVEGSWTLRAHDEHGHAGSWPLEVADADLEVELELGSATVEVHVTSIDGAPIAGADVRVVGVDPAAVRQVRARTGSGGVAIVETGSGPWRVEVSADGYEARHLEHAGEGPLEVVLEPRRRRALRVVAPGPTPTLVMVADPDTSETPGTLVLDPAGRGELLGFGSAQRLAIAADGWAPEVVAVTGRDDIEVALSPRIPVVVDLPEPGPMFVTATNAQGMPWIEVTHWGVRRRRQIEVPGAVLDLSPGVWILEAESVDPRLAGSSLHARVEVTQAGQRVVLGPARIMGTGDQGPD